MEFFFDDVADPSILLVPLPRGLRGFPRVFFSRAHDRAGFVSLLIGSDFVVYRNGRALIFDSAILDFVITTEFIEIQKVK